MKRDVNALANQHFDLLVIGAGAFGSCVAWDATLRGLNVALVESGDFGAATSANCYKVIHGGMRYLQHADLPRLRASARERSIYFRIAPHLTAPLPIAVPTYGYAMKGLPVLRAGLAAYDTLTLDRNRHVIHKELHVPRHATLDRSETLAQFPGLKPNGLTGAAVFNDGQMYSPERLTLAFVTSAAQRGATVANHTRADTLIRQGDRVTGAKVTDVIDNQTFDVHADLVINTQGPWAENWLAQQSIQVTDRSTFSRDAYFVVNRPWVSSNALAVQAATADPDAVLARGARHLFCVPWRDQTIVGVWHRVWPTPPDTVDVPDANLETFIDEVNAGLPSLDLTLDDVGYWNAGLVLFGDNQSGGANLSYGKRSRLIDHKKSHGIDGLLTLIGVRYTTARAEAQHLVDIAIDRLQKETAPVSSHEELLSGAHFSSFESITTQIQHALPHAPPATRRSLFHNYGSQVTEVLAIAGPKGPKLLPDSHVLEEEIRFACRREMAVRLQDVVMNRTELATAYRPTRGQLDRVSMITAQELGWSSTRVQDELRELDRTLSHKRYVER